MMDACPHCKSSWIGEPIPEEDQKLFNATHFKRMIGIEVRTLYDGVAVYQCPDCGKYSPVGDSKLEKSLFKALKEYMDEEISE